MLEACYRFLFTLSLLQITIHGNSAVTTDFVKVLYWAKAPRPIYLSYFLIARYTRGIWENGLDFALYLEYFTQTSIGYFYKSYKCKIFGTFNQEGGLALDGT